MTATDDCGAANASDTETVTITITGTNDPPTLTRATRRGAVTEEATCARRLTDSGTLSFTDVDANDARDGERELSTARCGATGRSAPARRRAGGRLHVDQDSWDYSVARTPRTSWPRGDVTLSFAVTATDDSGAANAATPRR